MNYSHYILVCGGSACESSHSVRIYENLIEEAKKPAFTIKSESLRPAVSAFVKKALS